MFTVILAAVAGWIWGAIWYGLVSKQWMADVGLTDDTINHKNIPAFVGSFVAALIVAGMMRHIFVASGVDSTFEAAISGLGLGLFIATPWLATNYLFAQRPRRLIFIDGMYSSIGSLVMGLALSFGI